MSKRDRWFSGGLGLADHLKPGSARHAQEVEGPAANSPFAVPRLTGDAHVPNPLRGPGRPYAQLIRSSFYDGLS